MGYIEKTHRKLKNFAKNLAVKTFLRPVKLSSAQIEKAKKISVSSEQINKIGNTTNVVFSINYNGEIFYFRSCRAHVKIKDYVFDLIREFCQLGKQDFLNRVLKLLSSRKHFKKFINMGIENDPYSPLAEFQRILDAEIIGLSKELYNDYPDDVYALAQYVWGEIYAYKLNSGIGRNNYQTFNSSRQIASYLVAESLGFSNLIPKVIYCRLIIEDTKQQFFGTLMKSSCGISPEKINAEDMRQMFSPSLQKQLTELNFLDVICYQKDHRPGNYNVEVVDDKIISISAFDNDAPSTFLWTSSIDFATYINCSSILKGKDQINRPYVSEQLLSGILNADVKNLKSLLKPYLNFWQLGGFSSRLKKVKSLLSKSVVNADIIILSDQDWTEETIKNELSGEFGITFLGALLEDNWRTEK